MNQPAKSCNPWPIAIIAFFVVLLTGIVVFIVFATRNKMELVRPDYYEEEIRFQAQLDRLNRTRPLNAQVAIAYDANLRCIRVTLPSAHAHRPTTGRIHFYRPSDASLDREVQLVVNRDGLQQVDTQKLQPGLWRVRIYWRSDDQDYFFDQSIVVGARPA
jgi:nitrogen fixation protein FixH